MSTGHPRTTSLWPWSSTRKVLPHGLHSPRDMCILSRNGDFGISSQLVTTTGSNDTTCAGRVTTSMTSAQASQEVAIQAKARAEKKQQRSLGIGLGVTFPLLALIGVAVGWWWYRRRRGFGIASDSEKQFGGNRGFKKLVSPAMLEEPSDAHLPHSSTQRLPELIIAGGPYSAESHAQGSSSSSVISGPLDLIARSPPTPSRTTLATMSSSTSSMISATTAPPRMSSLNSSSPPSLSARQRKVLEAGLHRPTRSTTALPVRHTSELRPARLPERSASASALPTSVRPTRPRQESLGVLAEDVAAEGPSIQHEDGGAVPEFPPPYADRRGT
jgi:hypothetical protein